MVVVGRIGAPYGLKGLAKFQSFTTPDTNILNYETLVLQPKKAGDEEFPVSVKPHGNKFIAQVGNVADRDEIAKYTNLYCVVAREEFEELEDDEYYLDDLMGLQVVNGKGDKFGEVVDFIVTGANDVLVVKNGAKEHLIPLVFERYILDVDYDSEVLTVDWELDY